MAQQSAVPTLKRGPGRPPKNATPLQKKQKVSISTPPTTRSPLTQSPATKTPEAEAKPIPLPPKITDARPLPTLSEPQPPQLSNDVYQDLIASAVLAASLDRSRLSWVANGILQRFWVKPETGKHAKPPPPGNPDAKLMKLKGPCRLRIEPHILEADVYVEEKAKPPPIPKQYVPGPNHNTHGPTHHRQQGVNQHYWQHQGQIQNNNSLPSVTHANQAQHQAPNVMLPPIQTMSPPAAVQRPPTQHLPAPQSKPSAPPPPAPAPQHAHISTTSSQDKKASQDPVISMLASRASSDPQLKALMKEVATGNASQDQLRIFQRHIDELSAIVAKQKKEQEETVALTKQQANEVQYNATNNGPGQLSSSVTHQAAHSNPRFQKPSHAPQPPLMQHEQPVWIPPPPRPPPPPPPALPVALAFTSPGSTEDRFLFPQNSILEPLSPQHTLASFIVVRKGRDAVDPTGLDPDVEYWQSVTLMIEVAYGREEILNCIRRWVKPADDVKKDMVETMSRCQRMPDTFLALRLPFTSGLSGEAGDAYKEVTPLTEDRHRLKSAMKSTKKGSSDTANLVTSAHHDGEALSTCKATPVGEPRTPAVEANVKEMVAASDIDDGSNRSKRRKSVRINE